MKKDLYNDNIKLVILIMSLNKYLLILTAGTCLAWISWFVVLGFINPFSAGWVGFMFFYVTLIFALLGTFSLLGYLSHRLLKRDEVANRHVSIASRQSVLLTILVVVALILQNFRLLMWWNVVILIVFTAFIELFFISYKKFDK